MNATPVSLAVAQKLIEVVFSGSPEDLPPINVPEVNIEWFGKHNKVLALVEGKWGFLPKQN